MPIYKIMIVDEALQIAKDIRRCCEVMKGYFESDLPDNSVFPNGITYSDAGLYKGIEADGEGILVKFRRGNTIPSEANVGGRLYTFGDSDMDFVVPGGHVKVNMYLSDMPVTGTGGSAMQYNIIVPLDYGAGELAVLKMYLYYVEPSDKLYDEVSERLFSAHSFITLDGKLMNIELEVNSFLYKLGYVNGLMEGFIRDKDAIKGLEECVYFAQEDEYVVGRNTYTVRLGQYNKLRYPGSEEVKE